MRSFCIFCCGVIALTNVCTCVCILTRVDHFLNLCIKDKLSYHRYIYIVHVFALTVYYNFFFDCGIKDAINVFIIIKLQQTTTLEGKWLQHSSRSEIAGGIKKEEIQFNIFRQLPFPGLQGLSGTLPGIPSGRPGICRPIVMFWDAWRVILAG